MKSLPVLWFLPFLLLSCNSTSNQPGDKESAKLPYHINLTNFGTRNLFLSEFADDISYVRLELNEVNVGDRCKVLPSPNGFVIQSRNQELMVFSKDGKFLNKIGRIGKGPQEYLFNFGTEIDFINNLIYIPVGDNNVRIFNLDGKFVKQYNLMGYQFNEGHLVFSNSKLYVSGITIQTDTYCPLTIFLSNGTKWKEYPMKFPPMAEKPVTAPCGTFELTPENEVLMNYLSLDTSFLITEKGDLKPYIVFNRGSDHMPPETRFFQDKDQQYIMSHIDAVYIKDRGPLILLINSQPSDFYPSCYIKASGEFFHFTNNGLTPGSNTYFGIQNDLDGGPSLLFYHTIHDHYAYCIHQAIDLIEWKRSGYFERVEPKFPEKKKALLEMIDSLKPDDNPVIMVVKIKN